MPKKLFFILCLSSFIVSASCKKYIDNNVIAINELMCVNSFTAADQNGEFDDWIELYNLTSGSVNLSGMYLSDSKSNIRKWRIPDGTAIQPNGFLIFWADKDTTQQGLHTDFKLSSSGEKIILSNSNGSLIDIVEYPAQDLELSYSRRPDGTGSFRWQYPSYNSSNGNK